MENNHETQAPAVHAGSLSDKEKALGAVAYIGPLFILSFLFADNSKFVKFHVAQGLVFFLAWLAIGYGLVAIAVALFMPAYGMGAMYGGFGFFGLIMMLVKLAFLLVGLFAVVKTVQGEMWEIPVLGQWARKIKL